MSNYKEFFENYGDYEIKSSKLVGFLKHYENDVTVEQLYQIFAQRMREEDALSTLKLMRELGE